MTPTSLTMQHLRRSGYLVEITERWIPNLEIRRDLFHVGDLIAVMPSEAILLVQCTSLSNVPARLAKAKEAPGLDVWLKTGHGRFQIFGWGHINGAWHPKIIELHPGDMTPVVVSRPPRKRRKSRWQPADLFQTVPPCE